MSEIPTFHNMTMGHEATPLSAAHLATAVDLVGLDYYHRATPAERLAIERRTTEFATRGDGLDKPSFACEMGAGFPPYFFPIPEEIDNRFNVMAALAYGLRGFNIYMAVDRDRWIGAPIDRHGRPGAERAFLGQALPGRSPSSAFTSSGGAPRCASSILRLKRRLNRALHAFSPATPALFAVLGSGSHETCFEDDFGLGGRVAARSMPSSKLSKRALGARRPLRAHRRRDGRAVALGRALDHLSYRGRRRAGPLGGAPPPSRCEARASPSDRAYPRATARSGPSPSRSTHRVSRSCR